MPLPAIRPESKRRRLALFALLSASCLHSVKAQEPSGGDLALAMEHYTAKRYSEARALFQRIADREPGHLEATFHLGRIALWFDDESTGRTFLEHAARNAPSDARILNALGDAYGLTAQKAPLLSKLGWATKSRSAYERAVELDPRSVAWRWSLLGYYMIAPAVAGGGAGKARREADALARLDPVAGRIARATLHLAARRHDLAFREFDEVLMSNPDDYLALYHVGRCADVTGTQLERGLASLRRCLELRAPSGDTAPRPVHVHTRIANILDKLGDPEGARRARMTAAALEPDFRPEKDALKN